ncbi:hypothetical protein ACFWCF_13835 [Rhodococcus sp. NPDC060090]|uniref:hypothetical protein n=1 Tax=Rhodococcus sp. NPDC060090 TaxID=3347056 RepID=UPI00365E048E
MEPRSELFSDDLLYFDDTAVRAVASTVTSSAVAADRACRRALGALEFGPRYAGERYRTRGVAVEDGYMRLRRALDEWTAATNRYADAAAAAADGYHDQERTTVDALREIRTEPPR